MKPRISAVINTLNEEKDLPFALRSVQSWVDEIVVVDMYSDDRTVDIAREFGAKVFFHERTGFVEPTRPFAVAKATGDWILVLDADELVPFPLSQRLLAIAQGDKADLVRIPWLNYLLGAPLMHTGWGPTQDAHVRFFKHGFLHTGSQIHSPLLPGSGGRVLVIPYEPACAILHFNYLDSADFLERLNRYTSIEAKQAFERGKRMTPLGAFARAAKGFWSHYIGAAGFRDGWRGFYLSLFMSFYRIVTAAKLQELTVLGQRERIESWYRQEAEEILRAYDGSRPPTAP
jgi:glycosyltransferase involved in cell wall biosynthesis